MDCALHRCGVTFVLDRAGVTGDDGASHNGMWDMSVLQVVPGLRLAAPRDAHPAARAAQRGGRGRRRPHRGPLPQGPAARGHRGRRQGRRRRRAGPQRHHATSSSSASARWPRSPSRWPTGWSPRASASPWSTRAGSSRSTPRSSTWPAQHQLVVSIEDNGETGGCGAVLLQTLNAAGVTTPFRLHAHPPGVPRPRQAGPDPRADRADPAGARPRHRRGHDRALRRRGAGRCRPPGLGAPAGPSSPAPGPRGGTGAAAPCPMTSRTARRPAAAAPGSATPTTPAATSPPRRTCWRGCVERSTGGPRRSATATPARSWPA